MDNRNIVPYNKELLIKHNAHINVEVVSGIAVVKYLYKYIFKGHDKAAINLTTQESEHDEINDFINCR